MFRTLSTTRLSAAALCLVLLPLAGHVPALAAAAALTGVLIALNAWEARIARRNDGPHPYLPYMNVERPTS